MSRNQIQMAYLYCLSIPTDQKEQKNVIFAHYFLHWVQKSFDLCIDKVQPHKRATFL